VRPVLQLLGVFVAMVGLLATLVFAVYALWWIVMFVMTFFPIIGRRHRHSDWARLQKVGKRKGTALRDQRRTIGVESTGGSHGGRPPGSRS
jgi:uncharacterized membrane protein